MAAPRHAGGRLAALALGYRFTLLFVATMLLANAAAGTFAGVLPEEMLAVWGIGQASVWSGDLARLLTGTFLSHDIDMLFRQVVFALLALGYTERVRGSWRAAAAFFTLDIGSTVILLTIVRAVPSLSDLAELNDVGMSMGGFGLVGLALTEHRLRWVLCASVLLAILAKIAVDAEPLTDAGHVIALSLGFLAGIALRWRNGPGSPA